MPKLNRRFTPSQRETRLISHIKAACRARENVSRAGAVYHSMMRGMYLRRARTYARHAREWLVMYYEMVDCEARR